MSLKPGQSFFVMRGRTRVLLALKPRLSKKPVYLLPQLRAPIVKPV